jgi:tetratricopeptide (TPR) repeat protein
MRSTGQGQPIGEQRFPVGDLLLLAPMILFLGWEQQDPIAQLPAPLQARLATLLDEVRQIYGEPAEDLITGVWAGDGRALATLSMLDSGLAQVLDTLMPRLQEAKRARAWEDLARQADLAIHLASATGRQADLALAANLSGNARVAMGDFAEAVAPFRRSIAAAAAAGDRHLQAMGQGNMGNALRNMGEFDDSIAAYNAALELEEDPRGQATVLSNRAMALFQLGDRASALREQLAQIPILASAQAPPAEQVVILARAANGALLCGELTQAESILDRADQLVDVGDTDGRAQLGILRAMLKGLRTGEVRDPVAIAEADEAFEEAWNLAVEAAVARFHSQEPHYAQGWSEALAHRLPHNRAVALLLRGVARKDANVWGDGINELKRAEREAQEAGDQALALRLAINRVALLMDAGQLDVAIRLLELVQEEAARLGLAGVEGMACGSAASMAAKMGELVLGCDVITLLARAWTLGQMHAQLVAQSSLSPKEVQLAMACVQFDRLSNERALWALNYGAWAHVARMGELAADKVRPYGPSFELANRLSGLLDAYERLEERERAAATATELHSLLPKLPPRALRVALRALARNMERAEPLEAVELWSQAADLSEQLRAAVPSGLLPSEANRGFSQLPLDCAQLLRRQGRKEEAWRRLQQEKARRLLDVRGPGKELPSLEQVRAALQPGEMVVDLAIEADGLASYLLWKEGFEVLFEPMDWQSLEAPLLSDRVDREEFLLNLARHHEGLNRWAKQLAEGMARGLRLLLVPDGPLHELPLHEICWDGKPWRERQVIGTMPCASWVLFASPVDATTSLVVGNSADDLDGAEGECHEVAKLLGVKAKTCEQCTLEALESAFASSALDVVHVAVHGRGDTARGARASLLFADEMGGVKWVPFEELARHRLSANLVVLSGCSTGVTGRLRGHELVSVARAALEAGAATVLASLWPVEDHAAAELMRLFYGEIVRRRAEGPCDLREALQAAGLAMGKREGGALEASKGSRCRDGGSTVDMGACTARGEAAAAFLLIGLPTLPAGGGTC